MHSFIHSFIFFGFGIESRALGRLDECLTMELLPQPFTFTLRQDIIISLGRPGWPEFGIFLLSLLSAWEHRPALLCPACSFLSLCLLSMLVPP